MFGFCRILVKKRWQASQNFSFLRYSCAEGPIVSSLNLKFEATKSPFVHYEFQQFAIIATRPEQLAQFKNPSFLTSKVKAAVLDGSTSLWRRDLRVFPRASPSTGNKTCGSWRNAWIASRAWLNGWMNDPKVSSHFIIIAIMNIRNDDFHDLSWISLCIYEWISIFHYWIVISITVW